MIKCSTFLCYLYKHACLSYRNETHNIDHSNFSFAKHECGT